MEVEHDWWIELRPNALTTQQIRVLRSVQPDKDAESIAAFTKRAREAAVLRIGPFWRRPQAVQAAQTLTDAGLTVSIAT